MNKKIKISTEELTIASGDYKLYGRLYVTNKDSPTIVLLHGLGFYSFEYEQLASLLTENGFNCLTSDFRCHGRSEGKRGYWTLQELVDDTKSIVDYTYNRFNDKIGIFGNSLGAIVAVFAASQDFRIKSVVASGCPSRPADFALTTFWKILLFFGSLLSYIIPLRFSINHIYAYRAILSDPQWIKKIKADNLITDARKLAPMTYKDIVKWDVTKVVSKVKAPLLVLQGKRDRLQPISQSKMLYNAANEPKEFRIIDTGHLPDIENVDLLSKILTEWFNKTLKGDKK